MGADAGSGNGRRLRFGAAQPPLPLNFNPYRVGCYPTTAEVIGDGGEGRRITFQFVIGADVIVNLALSDRQGLQLFDAVFLRRGRFAVARHGVTFPFAFPA